MTDGSALIAKIGIIAAAIGALALFYADSRGHQASVGFLACIGILLVAALSEDRRAH